MQWRRFSKSNTGTGGHGLMVLNKVFPSLSVAIVLLQICKVLAVAAKPQGR